MPQDIGVRFEFLFVNCSFWGWLPLAKKDEILVDEGDFSLSVQFTPDRVFLPPGQEVGVLEERNYSFRTLLAAVTVHGVSDELVAGIHQKSSSSDTATTSPRKLAQRVLDFVIARINRIISYARNIKGQYWLSEIEYDPTNLTMLLSQCHSQVRVGESNWVRWNPCLEDFVVRGRPVDSAWCIQQNDWAGVKEFVSSSTKPPLIGHLLSRL